MEHLRVAEASQSLQVADLRPVASQRSGSASRACPLSVATSACDNLGYDCQQVPAGARLPGIDELEAPASLRPHSFVCPQRAEQPQEPRAQERLAGRLLFGTAGRTRRGRTSRSPPQFFEEPSGKCHDHSAQHRPVSFGAKQGQQAEAVGEIAHHTSG